MFDIGFSEIVVIGVVALVVIGPERLPKTARTLGLLFGRLQRYVSDVKADISREMELDELRKLQREMQGAARDLEKTVASAAQDLKSGVAQVERDLNDATAGVATDFAPSTGTAAPSTPEIPADVARSDRQSALPGFDKI